MVRHQGLVKSQNFPRLKRAGEGVVTGTWKELGGGEGLSSRSYGLTNGQQGGCQEGKYPDFFLWPFGLPTPPIDCPQRKAAPFLHSTGRRKRGKWSVNTKGQIPLCESVHVGILSCGWKRGVGGRITGR